jgi:protoporphyrinogen oxidase
MSDKTVILGSGMAAWGAFDRLTSEGVKPTLFDKNAYPGGHTASFPNHEGFVFDDGPHISFTEIEEMQNVLADAVDGRYETLNARVDNWYQGVWVKHPAIAYLHALPEDLIVQILDEFIQVSTTEMPETASFANYHEWLLAAYGPTFANNFPGRYGTKYHTCGPEDMNVSWLGPRLYRPDLKEVLMGAVRPPRTEKHYIDKFRYPKKGGFEGYLHKFFAAADLNLAHRAETIDPSSKTVTFGNGHTERYDTLISSAPLPEMIRMLPNVPADVQEAASLLSCSQSVIVNVGVARDDLSPAHWRYIYDDDMRSVRLSFPHMFSPTTCPPGHGAVQVEVYYSDKYKPLDHKPEDDIKPVIAELTTMGVLREDDDIVFSEARFIEYANVIFDLDSGPSAAKVQDYLNSLDITYCGRYGDWAYIWTDQSYLSGQRAAQRTLDARTSA